jgi:DNA-3-methyladenine glycosylase
MEKSKRSKIIKSVNTNFDSKLTTKKTTRKDTYQTLDNFAIKRFKTEEGEIKVESRSEPITSDNMEINLKSDSALRLGREFYLTDVVDLSKKLLGKIIVRKIDGVYCKARIVETEAYKAPYDKACHAYNNRKTDRTKYFWQIGGSLYVYMVHSVNCLNITAATEKEPEAVLIRAVEPIAGIEKIKELRKIPTNVKLSLGKLRDMTNGPGKVAGALSFDRSHNGVDLCLSDDAYLIDDPDYKFQMERSVRINVDYADEWKYKPWRFYIKDNPFVSKNKIPYDYIDE